MFGTQHTNNRAIVRIPIQMEGHVQEPRMSVRSEHQQHTAVVYTNQKRLILAEGSRRKSRRITSSPFARGVPGSNGELSSE